MKIKEFISNEWFHLLLLLIQIIVVASFWNNAPDTVPIHWNLNGEADSFASKEFGLLFGPMMNLIVYIVLLLLPKIDPSGKNFEKFGKTYKIIRYILSGFFFLIVLLITAVSSGIELDMTLFMTYLILIFFTIFGNFLGNIKHNYFVGIRTPWTLANLEVWRLTHRFSSKFWVFVSLIYLIIVTFIEKGYIGYVMISYLVLISLVPVIYSFIVFKKLKNNN